MEFASRKARRICWGQMHLRIIYPFPMLVDERNIVPLSLRRGVSVESIRHVSRRFPADPKMNPNSSTPSQACLNYIAIPCSKGRVNCLYLDFTGGVPHNTSLPRSSIDAPSLLIQRSRLDFFVWYISSSPIPKSSLGIQRTGRGDCRASSSARTLCGFLSSSDKSSSLIST